MNNTRRKTGKRASGFVMVLTLFVMVMLATLLIGNLNLQVVDLCLVKNRQQNLRAYYIAEAGIADAIDQIQRDGTLATTEWETDFPSSPDKYSVVVTQGATTVVNSTGLTATANFSRELEVEMTVSGSGPYEVTITQWREVVQ